MIDWAVARNPTEIPLKFIIAEKRGQLLTAVKLGTVHAGFVALNFDYSDEYLWNWQLARGRSKKYPASEAAGDRDVLATSASENL